jgi:hypothetical protein
MKINEITNVENMDVLARRYYGYMTFFGTLTIITTILHIYWLGLIFAMFTILSMIEARYWSTKEYIFKEIEKGDDR